jgi:phosphohistidine phosphatase
VDVFLVQHARALAKEENPDRPLTPIGKDELRKVAAIVSADVAVDLARIWHSGKTRAAQTAEVLAQHFHPRLGVRSSDGLSPLDDPRVWQGRLAEMEQQVMLVGHLPYMERLAGLLIAGDPDRQVLEFQNAGIVCLRRKEGQWRIRWTVTPESIGAA